MSIKAVTVEDLSISGAVCACCGQLLVDVIRAVIHRRALYHGACWLQLMSARPTQSARSVMQPPPTRRMGGDNRAPSCVLRADKMSLHALKGVRIVVVDDDPLVRTLYAIALREAGATSAGEATETVELVDPHLPGVVVPELPMRRHDSFWLLRGLSNACPRYR